MMEQGGGTCTVKGLEDDADRVRDDTSMWKSRLMSESWKTVMAPGRGSGCGLADTPTEICHHLPRNSGSFTNSGVMLPSALLRDILRKWSHRVPKVEEKQRQMIEHALHRRLPWERNSTILMVHMDTRGTHCNAHKTHTCTKHIFNTHNMDTIHQTGVKCMTRIKFTIRI